MGKNLVADLCKNLTGHHCFGLENEIEIKFVDKLEKLSNGKFMNLISEIN
jgi:hypothetical protein